MPSGGKGKKGKVSKADVALGYIRKLYAIEREIKDRNEADRYQVRQAMSVPLLKEFKAWLEKHVGKVTPSVRIDVVPFVTLS
jgi:hypothetical protein